jgi:transposase-like protein
MPHDGLKAAITKILSATWQRCRVDSSAELVVIALLMAILS